MFFRIGVLKNFINFTGKHSSWNLFFKKLRAAFLKRYTNIGFPVKLAKFVIAHFLQNNSGGYF